VKTQVSHLARNCVRTINKSANCMPDATNRDTSVENADDSVDLEIGPGGYLFYVDVGRGDIRRIHSFGVPALRRAAASPTNGLAHLTVNFDGIGSSVPDSGETLAWAWNVDSDRTHEASPSLSSTRTYFRGGCLRRCAQCSGH
jgi:hypothetical protein